jgi:hypothetical protein
VSDLLRSRKPFVMWDVVATHDSGRIDSVRHVSVVLDFHAEGDGQAVICFSNVRHHPGARRERSIRGSPLT